MDVKHVFAARFPIVEPQSSVDLARLLSQAALFVGNDNGVSRLCTIFGTKTLALFKGQNYAQWGVRGRDAHSVEAAYEAQEISNFKVQSSNLKRAPASNGGAFNRRFPGA